MFKNLFIFVSKTRMEQLTEDINFKLYNLPDLIQISLNNAFVIPETVNKFIIFKKKKKFFF